MTTEEMKAWIDGASYEALLRRWRNAPGGSPWFQGEVGEYYKSVMARRQAEADAWKKERRNWRMGPKGGE